MLMSHLPQRSASVVLLIVVLCALAGCSETGDTGSGQTNTTTQATEKPAPPASKWSQVKAGLREQYGDRIKEITRADNSVVVGVKAEDNFTNGLILGGMDRDSGDTFKLIYSDVGMRPREVLVQGYLPLVDKTTGKESEDVVTVHALTRADAEEVNWDNTDIIEWDSYRTFKHPALD